MSDDRRGERQRHARQLMRALTGEGEPVMITETGDVSDHRRDYLDRISPSMSFGALVDLRAREAAEIRSQRQETYPTSEAFAHQNQREWEAEARTLGSVAYRLDLGFLTGENERLAHVIYETVMRLPDEVREFVCDQVVFISGAWGQAFRGMDWSERWMILLAPDLPEEDATGVVAHEIAHTWRGHGVERMGYSADEEREACDFARVWGFSGSGTRFDAPEDNLGEVTYIN